MPINKTIRSISHGDAQHVFINADYGISYLNLITGAIAYTAFTPNLKINFTIQFKDALYNATAKGLYKFDLKKSFGTGFWKLATTGCKRRIKPNNRIHLAGYLGK